MRAWIVSACLLGLQGSALLHAADCGALKNLKLPDTTITSADSVRNGNLSGPEIGDIHGLPAFCRVMGVLRPTSDSEITFEVWLPENDWNGRYLGVGNGGFAGTIGYSGLESNLRRGFATSGSDAGHKADALDASWAFGHPEKIADFGWRAVHLTAVRTKEIIEAYYGKPAEKSYFDSCSDGGREALMEAQRFPEDYDGILAGAPANAWSRMLSSGVDISQRTIGDPRAYISGLKLPAIEKAALAACDGQDGVKSGFINNPEQCHFDPSVLLCKDADDLDCLTAPQISALKAFYSGGKDGQGKSIFPGFLPGDEAGSWGNWILGPGPGTGAGSGYAANYFRYMVTGDPKWNILTANVDETWKLATRTTAKDLDSTDPDLSRFAARGGKLILYHGWNDPAISPWNTIEYYKGVQKQMGDELADSFVRLYMVPGMEHCAEGPGPNSFGQLGIPAGKGPKYGIFDALQSWVEKSTPAAEVIATKYGQGPDGSPTVKITRPLCPYPAVAKYKGTGDSNDSASFACTKP